MSKLRVRAEATTTAPPEALWALLADATKYAQWGPWNASGYEDPDGEHGPGAIRWMRYKRTTTYERILEADAPRHLAYSVVRGIPVRNYRADVTITPTTSGTHVLWTAEWDTTLLGRVVHRTLRTLYPEIMGKLVAAAEAEASQRA